MVSALLASIRQYSDGSPSRQIGISAVLNAGLSVTARTAGLVREIFVAAIFGVSSELDAYLMAFALIGFPSAVLINAVQSALIPELVKTTGNARRQVFQSAITGTIALMALALGVILLLLNELVAMIGWGFSPERQQDVVQLCYALIPYYFLAAVNLLGYGGLQADRRFAINGSLPAVVPLATIVVLLFAAGSGRPDARFLVYGVTVGAAIELVLIQIFLANRALTLRPGWGTRLLEHNIWRQVVVLVPGTAIWGLMPLVDQTIASGLGHGAIASLGYGARLPAAVNSVLVTAIGVSALPYLSKLISEGRIYDCRHTLRRLSRALLAAGTLTAAVLIAVSDWLVELLYQRGAFDQHARATVVPIQQAYAAQLPGMLVGMLAVRTHLAQGRGAKVTIVAAGTAVLYVVCAWLLSRWFGVVGIAATAATVSCLNAMWLYYSADRHLALSIRAKR